MAKVILIGYDGPGSGAAVVKCLHFTDADEANRYRASDTECFRFLTVRNPGGVRKQNENYKAPAASPVQGPSHEDIVAAQEAAEAAAAAEGISPPSPQEPVVDAEPQSGSPEAPAPPPGVSGKKKPS